MVIRILRSVDCKDLQSGYSIPVLGNAIINQKLIGGMIKSQANDWKLVYAFFNRVSKRCGYRRSVEAYNSVIGLLGKALAQKMKRDGISPNYVILRTMSNRYACAHMVPEAIEAYRLAGRFGLKDRTCFSNLVDALCKRKHVVVEAECLSIGENCDYPLDTDTFDILLRACVWEAREELGIDAALHGVHQVNGNSGKTPQVVHAVNA
ncbi:Pentatricopeptide repeat-containing protein [Nymphaea thermarum]|nr:Pentatricopeptide repeat-containing protein [Nymphaea thermarum]